MARVTSNIELVLHSNGIMFQLFVNDGPLGVEVDLGERQMARIFNLFDLAFDLCELNLLVSVEWADLNLALNAACKT